MSELPEELRDMLAESRRAHEPDPDRLASVRARLDLRATPKAQFDVAPPSVRAGHWWLWSGLSVLVVVVGAWLASDSPEVVVPSARRSEPAEEVVAAPVEPVADAPAITGAGGAPADVQPLQKPRIAREVRRRSATAARAPVPQQEPSEPSVEPLAQPPLPPAVPVQTVSTEEQKARPSTSDGGEATSRWEPLSVRTRPDDATPSESLQDEVRLITRARKHLAAGDWESAEQALRQHRMEYPAGQLQAERTALLTRARCLAGDLKGAQRLYTELKLLTAGPSLVRNVERACPQLGH